MNEYSICTDIYEIIAGTNNKLSPVFKEAANDIDHATPKGFGYIKNFIISIEELAKKESVKDNRISESRGNIKSFQGYKNIESAMTFIDKYLKDIPTAKECASLLDALEKYQPLYTEGYDKNIRLIVLEYENTVYLLITCLAMMLANNVDVVSNGSEIRIQKKSATTFGIIPETLTKLSKELSNRSHKEYLEVIIKKSNEVDNSSKADNNMNESVYVEGVADVLMLINDILNNVGKIGNFVKNTFNSIRKSLFGIIPLIRSIIFLRYKKKADTIIALEEQIIFIQQNIEQLQNRKNIDPERKAEIIKKQQAIIESRRKKAEKLRAELCEQEKDAATEIKKSDSNMKDTSGNNDDDYVLEGVVFTEADLHNFRKKNGKKPGFRMKSNATPKQVERIREDFAIEKLAEKHNFGTKKKVDIPWSANEIKEKTKKIAQKIFDTTAVDIIRLIPGRKMTTNDPKRHTETMIGGVPYWPKGMEWPSWNGEPMICLAQLNFDKLPKLSGFPSTGILQFFILDEESWDNKDMWKVVYHEKYDPKAEQDSVPRCTTYGENSYFPINGVYYPEAKLMKCGITYMSEHTVDGDYKPITFDEYEIKFANEIFEANWGKNNPIPKDIERQICSYYWEFGKESAGCRIGGWPQATQNDHRDKKHDIPLLTLDSEAGMMWGDCGVAGFYISKNNLKNKNFNDILFDWDCY